MSSKYKLKHLEKPEKDQNNEQNSVCAVGFEVDFSILHTKAPGAAVYSITFLRENTPKQDLV